MKIFIRAITLIRFHEVTKVCTALNLGDDLVRDPEADPLFVRKTKLKFCEEDIFNQLGRKGMVDAKLTFLCQLNT